MVQDTFFRDDPYQWKAADKQHFLLPTLEALIAHHQQTCIPFRRLLHALPDVPASVNSLEDLPMLPVGLFKLQKLISVPVDQICRQLTSSATTGQVPSRIFLDRETATLQTRALVMIVKSFIGGKRLPMIIVDSKNTVSESTVFNARAAGILGFANFGRDHFYLFDEQMRINWDGLQVFLEKHREQKIFLFGFTFMIWRYFYQAVLQEERSLNLGDSVLIHGGGWKRLLEDAVDNKVFNRSLRERLGIGQIHNYYSMVEQVGSIYMECEAGYLHAPNYADILVRDPVTLKILPFARKGLVQTFSILPRSYPGNSLLTEDIGVIVGEDDCSCGRNGKYFLVEGRLPTAELRGCSDTFATQNHIA